MVRKIVEFFLIQLIFLNNDKKNFSGIFLDTAYFLNNGKKNSTGIFLDTAYFLALDFKFVI